MGLILDTNFVITIERDTRRGVKGRAHAFFAACAKESFFITFTVAGELACGKSTSDRKVWEQLCRPYSLPYSLLAWTPIISWHFGETYRVLAAKGQLIGSNDIWIAATALAHGHSVVTNNTEEFLRVPGLAVEGF